MGYNKYGAIKVKLDGITFDSKLEYQNSKKNKKYFDKKIILEHKYNMSNFSRNLFFKQKSRFSKYSEALLNTVF